MASPIGHGIIGVALARRFGVRSPFGLTTAALAASLPDADIIAGALLHGDPWRIHRKGTHTLQFGLTAGALAGFAGLLGAESIDGERDLIASAIVGAVIVGSHVPLDRAPVPTINKGPSILGMSIANWLLDALIWGAVGWLLLRKPAAHEAE